ncbi:OsmC family protein [Lysinibacillus sp. NPDC096418]|uniref:OsmC family protein n=1 Tax=Lysinibacillus sp. NPDC096418 TaxID=3364138 RepID=UPI0037F27249
MTTIQVVNGQNEVRNEAGFQVIGSIAPNQEGLSPKELLEAALGLCISISLQKVLARDEVEVNVDEIEIQVTTSKDEGITNRFVRFDVTVQFPSQLDNSYKEKLIAVIERACTIGNTLKNDVVINTVEKR